jgi:nucleotide-binding universal stress UspA family protein
MHVLIATDGSEQALAAARLVPQWLNPAAISRVTVLAVAAGADPSSLYLGYDLDPMGGYSASALAMTDWEKLAAEVKRAGEAATKRTAAVLEGLAVPVETVVRQGAPANEILQAAEELHADLIVMGSRGWGQLKAMLLGSVSEHVLHHATCPVLIARATADEAQST